MTARPFLRWPGGKGKHLDLLLELMPPEGSVHSICLGGGSLEFALLSQGREVRLCDVNGGLINAYKVVRDDLPRLLQALEKRQATLDGFHAARDRYNRRRDTVGAAADLIQLNRQCFNGLYRENPQGEFNVSPDPGKVGCDLVREELLQACSEVLQGVDIKQLDFRSSLPRVSAGETAWIDSPYWPGPDPRGGVGLFGATLRESFTAYTAAGFGSQDHVDLLNEAKAALGRGAAVLSTNAWEEGWVSRYRKAGFQAVSFNVARNVSCQTESRAAVREALFIGGPS